MTKVLKLLGGGSLAAILAILAIAFAGVYNGSPPTVDTTDQPVLVFDQDTTLTGQTAGAESGVITLNTLVGPVEHGFTSAISDSGAAINDFSTFAMNSRLTADTSNPLNVFPVAPADYMKINTINVSYGGSSFIDDFVKQTESLGGETAQIADRSLTSNDAGLFVSPAPGVHINDTMGSTVGTGTITATLDYPDSRGSIQSVIRVGPEALVLIAMVVLFAAAFIAWTMPGTESPSQPKWRISKRFGAPI